MTSLNDRCKACGHLRGEHSTNGCYNKNWKGVCLCFEFEEGYQDVQRTFTITERVWQTRIDCRA